MTVNLTSGQLATELRLETGASAPEGQGAVIDRLNDAATAFVEMRAPGAPDDIQTKAVVMIAGYIYDGPLSAVRQSHASAWLYSGAASLCKPWIERRAQAV